MIMQRRPHELVDFVTPLTVAWGLGLGLGFGVWGLGFRVEGLGLFNVPPGSCEEDNDGEEVHLAKFERLQARKRGRQNVRPPKQFIKKPFAGQSI